jgi:hypothetical protein
MRLPLRWMGARVRLNRNFWGHQIPRGSARTEQQDFRFLQEVMYSALAVHSGAGKFSGEKELHEPERNFAFGQRSGCRSL